jgi:ABC-type glycerol-3-phosphate transport system substrate-binding protein
MNKKVSLTIVALLITASMVLAACQPQVVTETVEVVVTQEVPVEVEVPAEPVDKTVVEFWTTDNEEARVDVYEELAAAYMAEHPDVDLRIVPTGTRAVG